MIHELLENYLLKSIDYVEYGIDKFAGTCCEGGSDDDSNTSKIKVPEVFAPEGVFKGLDEVESTSTRKEDIMKVKVPTVNDNRAAQICYV